MKFSSLPMVERIVPKFPLLRNCRLTVVVRPVKIHLEIVRHLDDILEVIQLQHDGYLPQRTIRCRRSSSLVRMVDGQVDGGLECCDHVE